MRVFSRIGIVSIAAVAGAIPAAASEPLRISNVGSSLTSVATGQSSALSQEPGRSLAVHIVPRDAGEAGAEFAKAYAAGLPRLAGLSQIFVFEGGLDDARKIAARSGVAETKWSIDPDGVFARELGVLSQGAPSLPAIIVFDPAGAEMFREIGHGNREFPAFATFESRFRKADEAPSLGEYNLPTGKRLALEGYDPVAYIAKERAVKGSPGLISWYRGVQYQFASESHRAAFAAEPEKFLPTYGGWCATAMGAKGTKVEIDPTNFKVSNGRLFLFYKDFFSDAKKDWNKHEAEWEPAADVNWKKLSGEEPVKPAK